MGFAFALPILHCLCTILNVMAGTKPCARAGARPDPRTAAAGTAMTFADWAIVTETWALMPTRSVAGGVVTATVTSYDTTPLEPDAPLGG